MHMHSRTILIRVSKTFELAKVVCNHGIFMMAPNSWDPSFKKLVRTFRLVLPGYAITHDVSIQHCDRFFLCITVGDFVDDLTHPEYEAFRAQLKAQVMRMLRLSKEAEDDDDFKVFHSLHVDAAKSGFGRLFRSPSLFEDIIKAWLLCNCRLSDSLEMAEGLCKLTVKRKRGRKKQGYQEPKCYFPCAQELSGFSRRELERKGCHLGHRADNILLFATEVANGNINLDDLEMVRDGDELYRKLRKIRGIGDFLACNVLMCMGFYHRIPIDSETVRHVKQIHQRKECTKKNVHKIVKEIYDKYEPYQALAYWFELIGYYENHLGKLSELEACDYKKAAGSFITSSMLYNTSN